VQVIDAICINISETDQAIAAVMVTVDAMRCTTRAKRITRSSAIRAGGCAIMIPFASGACSRACQFETVRACSGEVGAGSPIGTCAINTSGAAGVHFARAARAFVTMT
jgi:hypothetical protein